MSNPSLAFHFNLRSLRRGGTSFFLFIGRHSTLRKSLLNLDPFLPHDLLLRLIVLDIGCVIVLRDEMACTYPSATRLVDFLKTGPCN